MLIPKKSLGQHFLTDKNIAEKIVGSLSMNGYSSLLEIGPGMGILTKIILEKSELDFKCVEIDKDSVQWLIQNQNINESQIIHADFLKVPFDGIFQSQFAVIGNFPYNISSQILFRVIENRICIPEMLGMFQREVAERLIAKPSTKDYGILSVMVQAFFKPEILFHVSESVFYPPPKVKSSVIRLIRKDSDLPEASYSILNKVVRTAFQQRRKMLRNSLASLNFSDSNVFLHYETKRPEQLTVKDFDAIACSLQ